LALVAKRQEKEISTITELLYFGLEGLILSALIALGSIFIQKKSIRYFSLALSSISHILLIAASVILIYQNGTFFFKVYEIIPLLQISF